MLTVEQPLARIGLAVAEAEFAPYLSACMVGGDAQVFDRAGFIGDLSGNFEHPLDDSPCFPAFTGGAEVC
jgi:hypothetical protein